MEVRAGYKQTEGGLIPEDWDVKSLFEIALIERGKFSARPRNDPKYYGGHIPFIQTGDVARSKGCINSFTQTLNSEGLQVSRLFRKGTLFFTIAANIGDVGVIVFDAACPDSLVAISPYSNTEKNWLKYELMSRKRHFEKLASPGAQLNINLEKLNPYVLPHPPFPEQQAIATTLSDVDALLNGLDQLITKKRNLKQAAMQQLLTGQTRLPGFTGEWEVKRLGELFTFSGGHTASRDQLSDTGYCYLHYGDIHRSIKTFIDVAAEFLEIPKLVVALSDVSTASILKDGDVVFVDASEDDEGTSKHIVVVNPDDHPYISGLHTIVAKSKANRIDNLFKRYCFQTRSIKEQFRFFAVGTKVSGISKTSVAKVELHFPTSLDEQAALATVLSDMDTELTAFEARRDKTRALKQGMMQELLTGRIRLVRV